MGKMSARKKEKKKKRGSREKHRRRLKQIYRRDKKRCQRCGRKTVLIGKIPIENRIGHTEDGHHFVFSFGEGSWIMPVATMEHVVKHCDGGTLELDNLLLYCSECNNELS